MSSTLCWYPPPKPPKDNSLSDDLKRKLGRKLFDSDGSIGGTKELGANFIPYLDGLGDAGVKDAHKLADLIRKYGWVTVTWEY